MRSMACFDLKKFAPIWRGVLLVLGGLVVLGLVVWALWCIPPWQVEQVRGRLDTPEKDEYRLATLEDEYRRTLVQSIGGFFLLVGLYLTWRRIVATEKTVSVAQENVSVAQENVRVAQEGHITDRFTQAIAQLGDKEMAIRLGGIYALERIAKDSEKDHGPIMEVLTAYVRENARKQGIYAEEAAAQPTTDIQAILTVFGRRKTTGPNRRIGGGSAEGGVPGRWQTSGKGRGPDSLDLNHTHLAGAELISADLTTADLNEATLVGAKLAGAILCMADLRGADLRGATLVGADLSMAELEGADLRDADLRDADLHMADLTEADLSGAKLDTAELILATLTGAKNLTAEQVRSAKNWRETRLPDSLKHLKDLPDPPA